MLMNYSHLATPAALSEEQQSRFEAVFGLVEGMAAPKSRHVSEVGSSA